MPDELIDSLGRAVASTPHDVALCLHLAELLLDRGRTNEAIAHLAIALQQDPSSSVARALMARAVASDLFPLSTETAPPGEPSPSVGADRTSEAGRTSEPSRDGDSGRASESSDLAETQSAEAFDWQRAEADLAEIAQPASIHHGAEPRYTAAFDVQDPGIRLGDVGGLRDVKARLEAAFLAPLRNPELRRLYGKSLKGGPLLYGPPGCGKTFLARAVAGELGARFISVSLADILDMWIGQSERNLHDLFELARRNAPCVVFLDEVDAIGQKRTQLRHNAMRSTVNQLLAELDGVAANNEGVFVLAATNAPWDVDPALRRPGRLDRTMLVLPPDVGAREEILRHHLRDRPTVGIDVRKLARRTDGLTGADLAHLCETAAERALLDSARSGNVRPIGMRDLEAALDEVRPSAAPWFDLARNVALFANEGGEYDELLRYLKGRRLA